MSLHTTGHVADPLVHWRVTLRSGLILGLVTLFIALVGLVGVFTERDIIYNVLSMGQSLLFIVGVIGGYLAGRRVSGHSVALSALHGMVTSLIVGVVMALYLILATSVDLRGVLVNSSRELFETLSFGLAPGLGAMVLVVVFGLVGALAGLLSRVGEWVRGALINGLVSVLVIGVLSDLLKTLLSTGFLKPIVRLVFARSGLTIVGALVVFAIALGLSLARPFIQYRMAPAREWLNRPQNKGIKYGGTVLILAPILLALPWIAQLYLSDVIDNVGLFILMGLGLNIVVGFAGLLDLGYVAFFAIGAYIMALLTSPASFLGWQWSFWAALPVSMLVAGFAGILLGIPVLKMRGDYLAIVTLGFGEIIRILATSDALKPFIGGSQGILSIPKPVFFGLTLKDAQYLYYVVLVGCLVALYVAWRLSDSRIGRAWVAMREDEDVAEAAGINLVQYKLMAFAVGAMLSGMAGGIFASKLGSIFPHSFNLLISINVLALIIVGGMASLPGVFVGALILVGLPELLREFAEFRLLMYGAVLVIMMLVKPEGFWPAAQRQRELHEAEEVLGSEELESVTASVAAD